MTPIDVTFPSDGIPLAGHLYLPDDRTGPHPAVVVGHPASGVKEQAAAAYARHLVAAGFVVVTFDAAYQGQSGGLPRGVEAPAQRVEDIKSAVTFLTGRPEADPGRIGALGICASGGYVVPAVAADPRVRSVATVSAVDIALAFRVGADGRQDPSVIAGLLEIASASRTAEAAGAHPLMLPTLPGSETEARAGGEHSYDGWEYYRTSRGAHPRAAREFTASSIDRMVGFDAFGQVALLGTRPLLMVVGADAVTAWMSETTVERAGANARLERVSGATHVDLYDRRVAEVADRLVPFFRRTLAQDGLSAAQTELVDEGRAS